MALLTYGSLFSGALGLDLGLERAGWGEAEWYCESDPQARKLIRRHRPGAQIFDDATTLDPPPVDALAGGFPCQPLSRAGRKRGTDDERWLWPAFERAIRLVRPRHVLVENVPDLAVRGLDVVLSDLARLFYVGRVVRVRASDVGAPHLRERLFIVASLADPSGGRARGDGGAVPSPEEQGRGGPPDTDPHGLHISPAADAESERQPGAGERDGQTGPGRVARGLAASRPADLATDWGDFEAAIRRWEAIVGRPAPRPIDARGMLNLDLSEWMMGLPEGWTAGFSKTARARLVGNAVVVQVAQLIGEYALNLWEGT